MRLRFRILALTLGLVLLSIPIKTTSAEAPAKADVVETESTCTTTTTNHYIHNTVSSRGAVCVSLSEKVFEEPEPFLDRYYIPWAETWITLDEFKLISKVVQMEAGNQSIECQRLVAVCIINRLCSDKFPNTVEEVIYQPGAFEVTTLSWWPTSTYDDDAELATYYAVATSSMEPRDLYYFRDSYYHGFGKPYTYDGKMYFSTEE